MGIILLAVIGIFVFSFLAGVSEGLGGSGGCFSFLALVSLVVAMAYAVSVFLT